eukprot:scaffold1067_cov253-Prasinococcus_capsulatus_cf.AAC.3
MQTAARPPLPRGVRWGGALAAAAERVRRRGCAYLDEVQVAPDALQRALRVGQAVAAPGAAPRAAAAPVADGGGLPVRRGLELDVLEEELLLGGVLEADLQEGAAVRRHVAHLRAHRPARRGARHRRAMHARDALEARQRRRAAAYSGLAAENLKYCGRYLRSPSQSV